MPKGIDFERKFINIISEMIGNNSTNFKEVAEKAFPNIAKPNNKLSCMMNIIKKTGKPQGIYLQDAYQLAEALNLNLPDFIWRICKELEK